MTFDSDGVDSIYYDALSYYENMDQQSVLFISLLLRCHYYKIYSPITSCPILRIISQIINFLFRSAF